MIEFIHKNSLAWLTKQARKSDPCTTPDLFIHKKKAMDIKDGKFTLLLTVKPSRA